MRTARDEARPTERVQAWSGAVNRLCGPDCDRTLRPAIELACRQGLTLRRDQVRTCGVDVAVRRLVRQRRWSAPRRGIVSPLPPTIDYGDLPVAERSRRPQGGAEQIAASAAALARPGTFVTHESAAVMHGLPVLGAVRRPTLSVVDDDHRVVADEAIIRCAGVRPAELTDWFGAPVTTVERTVADISRSSGEAAGLVAADAALHRGLVTIEGLLAAREWSHHRPGIRTFDRVLELADERVESPLESLTRLCLVNGGLPLPVPQQLVHTALGTFRVDLMYPEQRVIVECDGEIKYSDPLVANPRMRERQREEALSLAGWTVVRVFWAEVRRQPMLVVARVRRELCRVS